MRRREAKYTRRMTREEGSVALQSRPATQKGDRPGRPVPFKSPFSGQVRSLLPRKGPPAERCRLYSSSP